jgi:hypothetical protein
LPPHADAAGAAASPGSKRARLATDGSPAAASAAAAAAAPPPPLFDSEPLNDEELLASFSRPGGELEVAELHKEREQRIFLASDNEGADPFRYGFRLPAWAEAEQLLATHKDLLVLGGNRSSKSEWAATKVVEVLQHLLRQNLLLLRLLHLRHYLQLHLQHLMRQMMRHYLQLHLRHYLQLHLQHLPLLLLLHLPLLLLPHLPLLLLPHLPLLLLPHQLLLVRLPLLQLLPLVILYFVPFVELLHW